MPNGVGCPALSLRHNEVCWTVCWTVVSSAALRRPALSLGHNEVCWTVCWTVVSSAVLRCPFAITRCAGQCVLQGVLSCPFAKTRCAEQCAGQYVLQNVLCCLALSCAIPSPKRGVLDSVLDSGVQHCPALSLRHEKLCWTVCWTVCHCAQEPRLVKQSHWRTDQTASGFCLTTSFVAPHIHFRCDCWPRKEKKNANFRFTPFGTRAGIQCWSALWS